jgi:hypothetical protein
VIRILENSGPENAEAAEKLKYYNTSPKFIKESDEIELPVRRATILKSGYTKWFEMDRNPRGLCLIINNLKSQVTKESLRLENVFKQLFFDVELCYNMKTEQMEKRLKDLAKEERLKKDNALVVMIISHGLDDHVEGVDGKRLSISSIVDIFSEEKCNYMEKT